MKKTKPLELIYSFKVIVPSGFEGVKPYGKIQTIDDFISHWLTEGYYVEDGRVNLPRGLEVNHLGFNSFPEDWWKELIPEEKWDKEVVNLKHKNIIL